MWEITHLLHELRGAMRWLLFVASCALSLMPVAQAALNDTSRPQLKAAGQWSSTGSMTTVRINYTATLLPNGKVLVAGGYDISSAEIYDPSTGSWSSTGSMSTARMLHTATLLPSGKVLVAGGVNGSGYLSSAEIYDPSTGSWSSTGSMSTARIYHTATLLPSGKVLVVGGSDAGEPFSSAEIYDPSTASWSSTGSMSTSRRNHTATLLLNGKLLVMGGYCRYDIGILSSAEVYDPSTGIWSNTGSLTTKRIAHTATLLLTGKVLVAGGIYDYYNGLSSAEVYDPSTGSWSNIGSMTTARMGHIATLLSTGKVLVVGGESSLNRPISSAEVYDPSTGSWSSTGSMSTARSRLTATLLSTGKVLVAGGLFIFNSVTSSAELYEPAASAAPTVVTNAPSVVTATSARLSGTVNPNGGVTNASFDWGKTLAYGSSIAAIPSPIDANAGPTNVYADVTDLSCNTLYNYRVNAENIAGVSYGDNQSFTTAQCRTVTPIIGTGCAVNPSTPQTVSLGNTTSFTVTPNPGYAINPGVRGTCPQGSWNGNVWTTGAITANCTVNLYCTQIPKPDFTITSITLTPASPNAGGNFSAVVTVKNQSTTGAGDAGQLTIWTNQSTVQTCGAVGDQTVTVGPLATGAVKTITITGLIANNSLDTQTLRAFIDSECVTAETNETNNQFTKTYRPIGVDLVVTSIALAPTSPLANNLVKATVTIKNQGNTAANAGYLDVWANKTTPVSCGDDGDAWAEVGTVAANTTKTLILNVPVGTAGSKTARAFVDSWCSTPETVETNNQFTKTYTVR